MEMIIIKTIIAVSVVLVLSIISELISPKIAGILSGFPTGSAIVLFFYGIEQGTNFASKSAIYNILGLVAMQAFIFAYYKTSSHIKKFNQIISTSFSISIYLLVIWLLKQLDCPKSFTITISIASIMLFNFLLKRIKNIKIKEKIKYSYSILLFRALLSGVIIVFITSIAAIAGPKWSGLFSAFPTTLFPLIAIIHYTYNYRIVHTIIKNVPIGLGSLLIYSFCVSITYPTTGIYAGTLLSFLAASVYLFIVIYLTSEKTLKQPGEHNEQKPSR